MAILDDTLRSMVLPPTSTTRPPRMSGFTCILGMIMSVLGGWESGGFFDCGDGEGWIWVWVWDGKGKGNGEGNGNGKHEMKGLKRSRECEWGEELQMTTMLLP